MRRAERRGGARLRASRLLAPLLGLLLLAGCTSSATIPDRPLASGQANPVPTALDWPANRPFVLMTFSGGGARATALALDTLEQLRRHGDGTPGRSLAADIAAVSGVSGGSVTAAWLGVQDAKYGRVAGPAHLGALRTDFLDRDNMRALGMAAANPYTLARLALGGYTRSDAVRDLLERRLFGRQTFAVLERHEFPTVILNATDMNTGLRFSFTPQRFNDICADLAALPVATAVAASAAVPVLLSPVTLRDYAYPRCPGARPPAPWLAAALKPDPVSRFLDPIAYEDALYTAELRNHDGSARHGYYLHLLDGGLADNLGIGALIGLIASPHAPLPVLRAINEGKLRRIVIVSVRARARQPTGLDARAATPGIPAMIRSVVDIPLDAASDGMAARKQAFLAALRAAAATAPPGAGFAGLRIYDVNVDFGLLPPRDRALMREVEAIPTSWSITRANRAAIARAARLLLAADPCFRRLLGDLGDAVPPGRDDAALCPQPAAPTS